MEFVLRDLLSKVSYEASLAIESSRVERFELAIERISSVNETSNSHR